MAKLSARGRTELARVTRERNVCGVIYTERAYDWGKAPIRCNLTAGHEGAHTGESLTSWEREERALMSDGKILSKRTCLFDHGRHDYGWTVRATVKAGVTPEVWRETHLRAGWTEAR